MNNSNILFLISARTPKSQMKPKRIQTVVPNAASVSWFGLPGWPAMKLSRWLAGQNMGPMASKRGLGMRRTSKRYAPISGTENDIQTGHAERTKVI